jgi:hypothetical protein
MGQNNRLNELSFRILHILTQIHNHTRKHTHTHTHPHTQKTYDDEKDQVKPLNLTYRIIKTHKSQHTKNT